MPIKGKVTTYTADEGVNVNLGQLGSAILTDASDSITPPSGMVIVALQIILSNTNIDALVAEDPTRFPNTVAAAHDGPTDALHGDGGDTFSTTANLMQGLTIYGRWTSVSVASGGALIAYFGK